MTPTVFAEILRQAVEQTPGAIGGAFAAKDGETVDSWTIWDEHEWAILTAHYGIVVNHIRSALHTFHFGDVEFMYVSHRDLDLLVQVVADEYFAMIALAPTANLGTAQRNLDEAAANLRLEML